MMDGVVYIATGERHIGRAVLSVESLKRHMPGVHTTIHADRQPPTDAFDAVEPLDPPEAFYLERIQRLAASPYARTLSLDSDTYVCAPFPALWEVLAGYDIAMVQDTFRTYVQGYDVLRSRVEAVPPAFPMLNAGVIGCRRGPGVDAFFARWEALYRADLAAAASAGYTGELSDQPALRQALYELPEVRLAVLPPEYNCRFVHPVALNEPVRILHGPHRDLPGVATEINRVAGNRVYLPGVGLVAEGQAPPVISGWRLRELRYNLRRRIRQLLRG
ncbi:MAG: hypothetical protein GYB64_19820 [Chloroflexi bacterium]|nr:hypothetical protein [Chloroflexota bacterium]